MTAVASGILQTLTRSVCLVSALWPAGDAVASPSGTLSLLGAHGFPPEQVVVLRTAPDGRVLEAHRADVPFEPASLAKLVGAAAALEAFAPDATFPTLLLAAGEVRDGVLAGDLVLRGEGDPLLDADHLLELALALPEAGIRRVGGRFLVDDLLLPRIARLDPTESGPVDWGAGAGALTVAFSRVKLLRRDPPVLVPPLPLPMRIDPALAGPVEIPGGFAVPPGRGPLELPLSDPGMAAAHLFRRFAADLGVTLPEPVRGAVPAGARVLARHHSPPLRELVRASLRWSNNQAATVLGLRTAREIAGRPLAPPDSARLLTSFLARRVPGVRAEGLAVHDHAGLDPASRMRAFDLAALLRHLFHRHALPALLAANGWPGTLERRLVEPDLIFRVRAKTGSSAFVAAAAGHLFPRGRPPEVFVLVLSDPVRRSRWLAEPEARDRQAAQAWQRRARAALDAVLARWLADAGTGG